MLRKSTYLSVGGYRTQFKYSQDYDLWLRMVKVCKFHTVKEFLYDRFVLFDGITYNLRKFPLQVRYALFAKSIALFDPEVQNTYIRMLNDEFLDLYYPKENTSLQKAFRKSIFTMLTWGKTEQARQATLNLITAPTWRFVLLILCSIFNGPLGKAAKYISIKASGTQSLPIKPNQI